MTFIYENLPSESILSLFALCKLPFSFKFITAPFIEKYTSIAYGKRKTWVVISQILAFFMIFIASFATSEEYEVALALIFLLAVFFITLQDISLDALAIK